MAVGIVAAVAAVPATAFVHQPDFAYRALDWPPGFRMVESGSPDISTAALAPFSALSREPRVPVPADPCAALFGGRGSSDATGQAVPVAYFFDTRCPFCRALSDDLDRLGARGRIHLARRPIALFGPASALAARAIIAAETMGAADALYARLIATAFVPTASYVTALAEAADLPAAAFATRLDAAETHATLRRNQAIAARMGIVGTPALVIGRTLLQGAAGRGRLSSLVAIERDLGPPPGCG